MPPSASSAKLPCELEREASLAGAARSENRDDCRVACEHELDRGVELPLAAQESGCRGREDDGAGRAQGRERSGAELQEAGGPVEVLEPVTAEVGQLRVEQLRGRLGEQDLAAVGEGGDAGAAVDVDLRRSPPT